MTHRDLVETYVIITTGREILGLLLYTIYNSNQNISDEI